MRGLRLIGLVLALLAARAADAAGADDALSPTVRIVFVGDIMLDDGPGRALAEGVDPFAAVADLLTNADLTIGNLECVVATSGEKVKKPYNFRADPRCIPLVKRYFSAVSVANNHSGDYGKAALVEQFERLEQSGLPWFGGGRNFQEAHRPLVLQRKGLRIALLGYNEFKPRSFEAGPDTPGIAWSDDDPVMADLRAARAEHHADLVIPFMHWGWELEPDPNDRQKTLARKMIDAGADLVVGNHPHIVQGVDQYRGRLIVYSLGNFVFDGFPEPEGRIGWILRLTIGKAGLVAWETFVVQMDDRGIPHVLKDAKSPQGTTNGTEPP